VSAAGLSRAGEDALAGALRAEGRIAVGRTTGTLRRLLKLGLIEAATDSSGEALVPGPDGEPTALSIFYLTAEGRACAARASVRLPRPRRSVHARPRIASAGSPREATMTIPQARQFARQMRAGTRTIGGLTLLAEVSEREDRISFVGGRFGAHSLCISASSVERVLVHWRGYVKANGLTCATLPRLPVAGDRVLFASASASTAMGGQRAGEVLRVTKTRCLVGYRFKYQQSAGPRPT
jgi:hypothetical protein